MERARARLAPGSRGRLVTAGRDFGTGVRYFGQGPGLLAGRPRLLLAAGRRVPRTGDVAGTSERG
ncbi:MAG TPA: hypothetical protein VH478_22890 [Trebonia sp.]|nr:hypothetical protein [Trebonia sp.]